MRRFLYLAFLLLAGCARLIPTDPEAAMQLVRQAEAQTAAGDFAGAAQSISAAIAQDRGQGSLYLQHGALLERMADPAGAREAYRTGLRRIPAEDPRQRTLAWRLGLLFALKLNAPGEALRLLPLLPGSAAREDLLGVLALQAGNPPDALGNFERALEQADDSELGAAILYHLSLAHGVAGDEPLALSHLYHAATRTRHPGLRGDLETLWARLSADTPAAPSSSPAPATIK